MPSQTLLLASMLTLLLAAKADLGKASAPHPKGKGKSRTIQMEVLKVRVPELLRAFQQKNDIKFLKEATELLELTVAPHGASPADVETFQSLKLRILLDAFNGIDSKRIVAFNFHDLPEMNVLPPVESGLPAGVDPASIRDPKLREDYQRQLAANRAKTAAYNLQVDLRDIDLALTEIFKAQVSAPITGTTKDALPPLIDHSIRSKERATSLKALAFASLRGNGAP
jgi:hypothetical protein